MIRGARRRARRSTMDEFHVGPYETAVGDAEMLIEVRIPLRPGAGSAHEKVERRAGDWAIAAASAAVWIDGGTIAAAGHRAQRGRPPTIHLTRAEELLRGQARRTRRSPRRARSPPRTAARSPTSAGRPTTSATSRRADPTSPAPRAGARPQPGGLTMNVSMTVNGEQVSREAEPRTLLVHFLRDTLGLKGTHWGCDTSNCGACVVLMDGKPVKSCTMLAAMAEGHEIRTVEGLERDGELDPVQQGFLEEHALQCGFCTPGMMMTARALLDENPNPTDEEIRTAISGQICRCTGYKNIVGAIRWAAEHEPRRGRRRAGDVGCRAPTSGRSASAG